LPHIGREFPIRWNPSYEDLHELSRADLDQSSHA
jgi:hypothetical protein